MDTELISGKSINKFKVYVSENETSRNLEITQYCDIKS